MIPLATRLLAGFLLILPLAALLSGLSVAPLVVLLAVALLALGGWKRPSGGLSGPQLLVVGLFIAWGAVSAWWSPDAGFALKTTAMLAGVVLTGVVLRAELGRFDQEQRDRALLWLAVGLAVAFVVMLGLRAAYMVQLWRDPTHPEKIVALLSRLNRGATAEAVLVWPALMGLWRLGRRRAAAGLAVLALCGLLGTLDLAAKVSILLAGAAFLAFRLAPRLVVGLATLAMVGWIALAPLAALHLPPPQQSAVHWMPSSMHHRLTIWSFAAEKTAEKPWFGWGMEAARTLGQKRMIQIFYPDGRMTYEELLPLHTHDAAIQVWLELGAVGAALLAGFVALTGLRLLRAPSAPALAVMVGAFVVSAVSYGVWQDWWLLLMWLAAALVTAPRMDKTPAVG